MDKLEEPAGPEFPQQHVAIVEPGAGSTIEFFVPGRPVPKGRPRVTKSGFAYTPKRTREWESVVAWHAKLARGFRPIIEGPVAVRLAFCGARVTADIDNLAKAVLDAMNRVVYLDDRQVRDVRATREVGSRHGVAVSVHPQ